MYQFHQVSTDHLSDPMVCDRYMYGSLVINWIVGQIDGALAVIHSVSIDDVATVVWRRNCHAIEPLAMNVRQSVRVTKSMDIKVISPIHYAYIICIRYIVKYACKCTICSICRVVTVACTRVYSKCNV